MTCRRRETCDNSLISKQKWLFCLLDLMHKRSCNIQTTHTHSVRRYKSQAPQSGGTRARRPSQEVQEPGAPVRRYKSQAPQSGGTRARRTRVNIRNLKSGKGRKGRRGMAKEIQHTRIGLHCNMKPWWLAHAMLPKHIIFATF